MVEAEMRKKSRALPSIHHFINADKMKFELKVWIDLER